MITLIPISTSSYKVIVTSNQKQIGLCIRDVDGFYYFWPQLEGGCWSKSALRAIADQLDLLNKDWEEHIKNDPTI